MITNFENIFFFKNPDVSKLNFKFFPIFNFFPVSISDGDNSHETPFPTLLDCLNEVKEDVGFFIELKYPSEMEVSLDKDP